MNSRSSHVSGKLWFQMPAKYQSWAHVLSSPDKIFQVKLHFHLLQASSYPSSSLSLTQSQFNEEQIRCKAGINVSISTEKWNLRGKSRAHTLTPQPSFLALSRSRTSTHSFHRKRTHLYHTNVFVQRSPQQLARHSIYLISFCNLALQNVSLQRRRWRTLTWLVGAVGLGSEECTAACMREY